MTEVAARIAAWPDAPPPAWDGVKNDQINQLLAYLALDRDSVAYAYGIARSHRYPVVTDGFLGNVSVIAIEYARDTRFANEAADPHARPFQTPRDLVVAANRVLRIGFLRARDENTAPPPPPPPHPGPDGDEGGSLLDPEGMGDLDTTPAPMHGADPVVSENVGRLRSTLTTLAATNGITCVHACYHARGSCPDAEVVLSVVLQILAYWEKAGPPVEGVSERDPAPDPPRAAKYGMLSVADPRIPARPNHVGARERQIVRRHWHCVRVLLAGLLGGKP